jgi:hypothetical protein
MVTVVAPDTSQLRVVDWPLGTDSGLAENEFTTGLNPGTSGTPEGGAFCWAGADGVEAGGAFVGCLTTLMHPTCVPTSSNDNKAKDIHNRM